MDARLTWLAVFATVAYLCFYLTEAGVIVDNSKDVMRAIVHSCTGCRLKSLPEVKRFIFNSIPLFHNVKFNAKPGADPVLVFVNEKNEEIQRIDLIPLTEGQCNDLLLSRGFYRKAHAGDTVPENYLQGPYNGVKIEERTRDL